MMGREAFKCKECTIGLEMFGRGTGEKRLKPNKGNALSLITKFTLNNWK